MVAIDLDGQEYELKASFKAFKEVQDKVGDLAAIAMNIVRYEQITEGKARLMPDLPMTAAQIVLLIAIGVRNGGCKLTDEKVADILIGKGVLNCLNTAVDYVQAFCQGPEVKIKGDEAKN